MITHACIGVRQPNVLGPGSSVIGRHHGDDDDAQRRVASPAYHHTAHRAILKKSNRKIASILVVNLSSQP